MSAAAWISRLAPTVVLALIVVAGIAGCGRSQADKALDSDANGYVCLACNAKFYTDREVFASFCPACKKPNVEQVLGFVCPVDKHVTMGTRVRGAVACEKCGKGTTAISIPRENELKSWGAAKKQAADVGG